MKKSLQNFFSQPGNRLAGLLFLLAFLQYANTLPHEYAWDDAIVITQNESVQKGITSIPDFFFKSNSLRLSDHYGYRPITLSSFALGQSLFGLSPQASHLVNVFLFALLCVILFNTLQKIFPDLNYWFAFWVTLLFIVHPIHVEVVANIKSRDEILALIFSLLSLQHFLAYYSGRKWKHLAASSGLFFLAFLSKEGAMHYVLILPLVLLFQKDFQWKTALPFFLIPVLLLGSAFGISRWAAQSQVGVSKTEGSGIFTESAALGNSAFLGKNLNDKLGTATRLLVRYEKNFLIPYPLVYYYGYNQVPFVTFKWPEGPPMLITHLLLFFFAFFRRKKYPLISFGILYFFLSIFIYLQLVFYLPDTMADRFMFSPSLGLCILLVALPGRIFKVNWTSDPTHSPKLKAQLTGFIKLDKTFSLSLLLVLLVLSGLTFSRNQVWKNNLSLFSADMPNLKNCSRCHKYYAGALSIDPESRNRHAEIESHYLRAIEIADFNYYAWIELAMTYNSWGEFQKTINLMGKAEKIFPEQSRIFYHRGLAHFSLQEYPQAVQDLKKAMDLAPKRLDTQVYYGRALYYDNRQLEAITHLQAGINRFPGSYNFHDALSDLYLMGGNAPKAIEMLYSATQIAPQEVVLWQKLIGLCRQVGRADLADQYYAEARQRGILK